MRDTNAWHDSDRNSWRVNSDWLSTKLLHTSFTLPGPDIHKFFQDNYAMAPAVLNLTVNQTASFGYQDGTAGMVVVGSRTTRRDSQGDSVIGGTTLDQPVFCGG